MNQIKKRLTAIPAMLSGATLVLASFASTGANEPSPEPAIREMPVTGLEAALTEAVAADPANAGKTVAAFLSAGRPDTREITQPTVATAIRALGEVPPPIRVGDIVYHAVRTLPESVLDIVRAATATAPHAAEEIVKAAISAVDDPFQEIIYRPTPPGEYRFPERTVSPDGRTMVDGKTLSDGKSFHDDKGADPGQPMTLAEAIPLAAAESAPGLDLATLIAAADEALHDTPGDWRRRISNPDFTSPVGEAGRTNFGNEPRTPWPHIGPLSL